MPKILKLSILISLMGLFYFGSALSSPILDYVYQGQPSPLASEVANAPILPAMSFSNLVFQSILPICGIIGAILYFILWMKSFNTEFPSSKIGLFAAILFICGYISLVPVMYQPLPTKEQNALSFLLVSLPLTLGALYSVWVIKISRR